MLFIKIKRMELLALFFLVSLSVSCKSPCGKSAPKENSAAGRANIKEFNEKKDALPVNYALTPPKIDGSLDDKIWSMASVSNKFHFSSDKNDGFPPLATDVRLLWDDKCIYIGFSLEDADIWADYNKRDDPLFDEEVVEVFLMPAEPDGYFEIQVNPRGVLFDAHFDSHRSPDWRIAAAGYNADITVQALVDGTLDVRDDKDKGWSVEIMIPFAALSQKRPEPGDRWKANFYRFEQYDRKKPNFAAALFQISKPDFHYNKDWGYIEFIKESDK